MDSKKQHKDPNQILMRQFGQYLNAERSLESIEDPLIKGLLPLQDSYQSQTPDVDLERAWARIELKLNHSSSKVEKMGFSRLTALYRSIALVASVILIGLFLLRWLNSSSELNVYRSSAEVKQIILSDGSEVTLRPYSTLEVLYLDDDKAVYQLQGEAYFKVRKQENGRLFDVQTANGQLSVLGTEFNVSFRNDIMRTYLKEGRIALKGRSDIQSRQLYPGQAAEITKNGLVQPLEKVKEADVLDWLNETFRFTDTEVGSVLPELEQHFAIRIHLPDSIAQTKLSGSIQLESAEETLGYLGIILGGRFQQNKNGVFEFEPKDEG